MREYQLRLSEYGITPARYRELDGFCRQYQDKKLQLIAIRGGFNDVSLKDMPRGTATSDPTAQRAERCCKLSSDTDAIEQAAKAAGDAIAPYIIKHVTLRRSYYDLKPPCGVNQFYAARKAFYVLLHRKLENR